MYSLKWDLIHRDRESSVIRPLFYLQATTAGSLLLKYGTLEKLVTYNGKMSIKKRAKNVTTKT